MTLSQYSILAKTTIRLPKSINKRNKHNSKLKRFIDFVLQLFIFKRQKDCNSFYSNCFDVDLEKEEEEPEIIGFITTY